MHHVYKKILSSILLIVFLFSFVIDIRFFSFVGKIFASESGNVSLVALFVEEGIYGPLKDDIFAYAQRIQKQLEHTRTIVIPVPERATPYEIASLSEKLYFDGGKEFISSIPGTSKLVGSVFIGNIPLPVVEHNGYYEKTVLPYVDFEDPAYVYDKDNKKFIFRSPTLGILKAEIFHGFISPNTGEREKDIEQIRGYFQKNRNFYEGTGQFSGSGVIHGNEDRFLSGTYTPYVFYFDQWRESKGINYASYRGYQLYTKYIEEISRGEYSQELVEQILEEYFRSLSGALANTGSNYQFSTGIFAVSDIQTKYIVTTTLKKFIEIFGKSTIGEMRKNVYNAGRYNEGGNKVNAHFVPYIISLMDAWAPAIVGEMNMRMENRINEIIQNGLSRNIGTPVNMMLSTSSEEREYYHFYDGMQGDRVTSTFDCTIYRGSMESGGTLVEANRGYNLSLVEHDLRKCPDGNTQGYWGGNSPLNLDGNSLESLQWRLNSSADVNKAIERIFDIVGSVRSFDPSRTPSPLNCYRSNYILTRKIGGDERRDEYQVPINGRPAINWNCATINQRLTDETFTFERAYTDLASGPGCSGGSKRLYLDGVLVKQVSSSYVGEERDDCRVDYYFKRIPSIMTHTSPTPVETLIQQRSFFSPALPIDKVHYVDFIAADGRYARLNYPNISNKDTYEGVRRKFEAFVQALNGLIIAHNPDRLTGVAREIYELLKRGPYPQPNFRPEQFLTPEENALLAGALYWENISSITEKYQFVLEHYLSFAEPDRILPRHRDMYEIAYLGAPASANGESMYIKVDPEELKDTNPYSDIFIKNIELSNLLQNVDDQTIEQETEFSCSPPDGVPLRKWLPAVICRIKEMLPPTIKIKESSCSDSTLFLDEEDEKEAWEDDWWYESTTSTGTQYRDMNKNGIDDVLEKDLEGDIATLQVVPSSSTYSHHDTGYIEAFLLNRNNTPLTYDPYVTFQFSLERLVAYGTGSATEVIFDRQTRNNEGAWNEVKRYITFSDREIRAVKGKAKYIFSTKGKNADVHIKVKFELKDVYGNVIKQTEKIVTIQIRGSSMSLDSYRLYQKDQRGMVLENGNTVRASSGTNVFLTFEPYFTSQKHNTGALHGLSLAEEKLFLLFSYVDSNRAVQSPAFPLYVTIYDQKRRKIRERSVLQNHENMIPIESFRQAGVYIIRIEDSEKRSVERRIVVTPGDPHEIKIHTGTNMMEKGGIITSHMFSVVDIFGNAVAGKTLSGTIQIEGRTVVFEDGTGMKNIHVLSGYAPFRLKTTNNTGSSIVKIKVFLNERNTLEGSFYVYVVDSIPVEVQFSHTGALALQERYSYGIHIPRVGNETIRFHSRAYVTTDKEYMISPHAFVPIENNRGTGEIVTKTKAGLEIPLIFYVEGKKDPVYVYKDIYAGDPIRIYAEVSKGKASASSGSVVQVFVHLFDRYGNRVIQDSQTRIHVRVDEAYRKFVTFQETTKQVRQGQATFLARSTGVPGTAYFVLSADPSIERNSFVVKGSGPFPKNELTIPGMKTSTGGLTALGRKFFEEYDSNRFIMKFHHERDLVTSEEYRNLSQEMKRELLAFFQAHDEFEIKGVNEYVGKIEFFGEISTTSTGFIQNYNALYTTLLGGNYGDITSGKNLGNALIFSQNNRALAVTSLLSLGKKYYDIAYILPNGKVEIHGKDGDLSQDIVSKVLINEKGGIEVRLHNRTFGNEIATVYYIFGTRGNLVACERTIEACFSKTDDTFALKALDSSFSADIHEMIHLQLKDKDGNVLFWVNKQAKTVHVARGVSLSLRNHTGNGGIFTLHYGGKAIGEFGISFVSNQNVSVSRNPQTLDDIYSGARERGSIFVYVDSMEYSLRSLYTGDTTDSSKGIALFFDDPIYSERENYSSPFSRLFEWGYETYYKHEGLGWKKGNKILLSFAAGKTVGEATKDFQSFGLINLGDPLISLLPLRKPVPESQTQLRKFDTTIGHMVFDENDMRDFTVFDYNRDGKKDIAFFTNDGRIGLLEGNHTHAFVKRGDVVYLPFELKSYSHMESGDFQGDGYEDILVFDTNGVMLIDNTQKDFSIIPMKDGADNVLFGSGSRLENVKVLDMDRDGKSDIVILDKKGNIAIYYGTENQGIFTRKFIDRNTVSLSESPRNDGSAIYFDGLYQLPDDTYNTNLGSQAVRNLTQYESQYSEGISQNEALIDKLIYTKLVYDPQSTGNTYTFTGSYPGSLMTEDMLASGKQNDSDIQDIEQGIQDGKQGILSLQQYLQEHNNQNRVFIGGNTSKSTTFIRSQYAHLEGLQIQKIFQDVNRGNLEGGDKVELRIQITNTGTGRKTNIAFADDIPQGFAIDSFHTIRVEYKGQVYSGSSVPLFSVSGDGYDYLVDRVVSTQGNVQKFSLDPGESLTFTILLQTLPFQAGYIEVGYLEDPTIHGDIAFKWSKENCGQEYILYKSVGAREYQKETKTPVCENKMPIEYTDTNKNNIPDYVEEILTNPSSDAVREKEEEWYNSILESYSETYDAIEETLEYIDNILDGLSCGFGGGGCIATPLNWAPLAPGNDPTLFGFPAGDGLWVGEGLPMFAAPTRCLGRRSVWGVRPPCPIGAGGRLDGIKVGLGISKIRIFVTPTITGAIGVALCFGKNNLSGWIPIPGLSPYIPGGNCIIAAVPLIGCKDDGTDGEFENMVIDGVTLARGGCSQGKNDTTDTPYLGEELAREYIEYKKTGTARSSLKEKIWNSLSQVARTSEKWQAPSSPLISVNGGNTTTAGELTLSIDWGGVRDGNFEDVVQVQMKRISPFPDFIMDWVTRQIEEIVTKLTDFPTLFIILPQFEGVFDEGWKNFSGDLDSLVEKIKNRSDEEKEVIQTQIDALQEQAKTSTGAQKVLDTLAINRLRAQKALDSNMVVSGIKEVYEFIGNLPLVRVQEEKVYVNIPWIDESTLQRALIDFELTRKQREREIAEARKEWNLENYNCVANDSHQGCKIILDAEKLLNSLDRNIEILESYRDFPKKLYELLKIREIRLQQLLCNLETLSEILGGRIGENGKRFKAWVELFILMKAILKSWQLLVDVFIDYDAQCHECKNERRDLMYFVWKLIDIVMPEIPVIQFPKWPDIYLDLHNIRVGLTLVVPDFEFNLRPIVLPVLPALQLPKSPEVRIILPDVPLLPEYELPELPDLPSIPEVDLPDLPPPPKLPKLFSVIEVYLNILKLITKAMCLLKANPLVPEWRAGDQIAFITERTGYLDLDFLDISLPQFTFPFVDAIKITTYVNLEFESAFLVEMARNAVAPINTFTNNIMNMFNIGLGDLDFSDVGPGDVEIEIERDGDVEMRRDSYVPPQKHPIERGAMFFIKTLYAFHALLKEYAQKEVSLDEAKRTLQKELASPLLKETDAGKEIYATLSQALGDHHGEETVRALLEENKQKFSKLKQMVQERKQELYNLRTSIFSGSIENITGCRIQEGETQEIRSVSFRQGIANSIRSTSVASQNTDIVSGGEKMVALLSYDNAGIDKNVKHSLDDTFGKLERAKSFFRSYMYGGDGGKAQKALPLVLSLAQNQQNQSVAQTDYYPGWSMIKTSREPFGYTVNPGPCVGSNGDFRYNYEGMYVIEWNNETRKKVAYRLFDYKEELHGNEEMKEIDMDGDGDEDIIYMMGNALYIKENTLSKKQKQLWTGRPYEYNGERYFGNTNSIVNAPLGLRSATQGSEYLYTYFEQPRDSRVAHFSLEMYRIVDKFSDESNGFLDSYVPTGVKKYIIDAFRDILTITQIERVDDEHVIMRGNLAMISVTSSNLAGVLMKKKKMKNITEDIRAGNQVSISKKTMVYAGRNSVRIEYFYQDEINRELRNKTIVLPAKTSLQFKKDAMIVNASGPLYVALEEEKEYTANEIISVRDEPLLPGTMIYTREMEIRVNRFINIEYYNGNTRVIDFSKDAYYELYDLGNYASSYVIRTNKLEDDWYYAKMKAFAQGNVSPYSSQILLSAGTMFDTRAPEILSFQVQVPVYQEKTIDITKFIREDMGNRNIEELFIDFFGERDTSGDGDPKNDRDIVWGQNASSRSNTLEIQREGILDEYTRKPAYRISLHVYPFDTLVHKMIRVRVKDKNGNVNWRDIPFWIYGPSLGIETVEKREVGDVYDVIGKVHENLVGMPISLYRVRGKSIEKLKDNQTGRDVVRTVDGGRFQFQITDETSTGASAVRVVYRGDMDPVELLRINEHTGKIDQGMASGVTIQVYPSGYNNEYSHPVIIVSHNGTPIYYQYLVTPEREWVKKVEDFSYILREEKPLGVYYKHIHVGYDFYQIPLGAPYNGGDGFIYDKSNASKEPLIKIFKDGRIVMNENFALQYATFDRYVVYRIVSRNNEVIGEVLVIPEGNYVIK